MAVMTKQEPLTYEQQLCKELTDAFRDVRHSRRAAITNGALPILTGPDQDRQYANAAMVVLQKHIDNTMSWGEADPRVAILLDVLHEHGIEAPFKAPHT